MTLITKGDPNETPRLYFFHSGDHYLMFFSPGTSSGFKRFCMERIKGLLVATTITLGTDLPHCTKQWYHLALGHSLIGAICIVIYSCQLHWDAWTTHGGTSYRQSNAQRDWAYCGGSLLLKLNDFTLALLCALPNLALCSLWAGATQGF